MVWSFLVYLGKFRMFMIATTSIPSCITSMIGTNSTKHPILVLYVYHISKGPKEYSNLIEEVYILTACIIWDYFSVANFVFILKSYEINTFIFLSEDLIQIGPSVKEALRDKYQSTWKMIARAPERGGTLSIRFFRSAAGAANAASTNARRTLVYERPWDTRRSGMLYDAI